ncbi:MAG: TadE/TadG family type IV pilus assembly protein [Thermodesulfobacteriota bacterium]|nr:TadE/TadG family type IV pilus assembly protein [Thermodesulfobacteriota bacterium]
MLIKFKSKRGIALVEFAIVLPLLLLILMGIIEFSLVLYDKAILTNASREGARRGIVSKSPRVTDAEIRTVVKNYCQNFLITFGSDTLEDGDIVISPPEPRDGLLFGTDLTVIVNYRYDFLVLPSFMTAPLGPINLAAQTLMKLE